MIQLKHFAQWKQNDQLLEIWSSWLGGGKVAAGFGDDVNQSAGLPELWVRGVVLIPAQGFMKEHVYMYSLRHTHKELQPYFLAGDHHENCDQ